MDELAAAKECDRVKAAARASPEAPAQLTPHGGNRRTSGADALRSQSNDVRAERPADPKPNEAIGTENRWWRMTSEMPTAYSKKD
jgi:hypothetical protein